METFNEFTLELGMYISKIEQALLWGLSEALDWALHSPMLFIVLALWGLTSYLDVDGEELTLAQKREDITNFLKHHNK